MKEQLFIEFQEKIVKNIGEEVNKEANEAGFVHEEASIEKITQEMIADAGIKEIFDEQIIQLIPNDSDVIPAEEIELQIQEIAERIELQIQTITEEMQEKIKARVGYEVLHFLFPENDPRLGNDENRSKATRVIDNMGEKYLNSCEYDLDSGQDEGSNLITIASCFQNIPVVEKILENKNFKKNDYEHEIFALGYAITNLNDSSVKNDSGEYELIHLLLNKGNFDPNTSHIYLEGERSLPLVVACWKKDVVLVKQLLKHPEIDIFKKDSLDPEQGFDVFDQAVDSYYYYKSDQNEIDKDKIREIISLVIKHAIDKNLIESIVKKELDNEKLEKYAYFVKDNELFMSENESQKSNNIMSTFISFVNGNKLCKAADFNNVLKITSDTEIMGKKTSKPFSIFSNSEALCIPSSSTSSSSSSSSSYVNDQDIRPGMKRKREQPINKEDDISEEESDIKRFKPN